MASKKPAAAKTAAAKAKPAPAPMPGTEASANPSAETNTAASLKRVWTLPVALLMLIVAAGGLWLAVRDSSNAPQAATVTAAPAMKPDAPATTPAKAPASASTTAAASAKTDATSSITAPKPVSITGCLQQDGSGFVLKNTEGTDAPKSRSWKSGFFKKRSASIDLLDAANATHLASHVGERVSVTGPLVDREMRVQSLHRVAAACQ